MATEANQILGPISLACLMFIVGLELTPADFRRVLSAPLAVVVGTLGQILLLPLMTWGVVVVLDLPPSFGAGVVLVAVSPGAGISNVLAAVAGANIALSVTLTAFTSVLSVVTLPIVTSISMQVFLESDASPEIAVGPLVEQLTFALLLPIGIGMGLRTRFPEFVVRNKRTLQRVGGAIIGVLLLFIIFAASQEEERVSFAGAEQLLLAAAVWTAAAMVIGWAIATMLRLERLDRRTFVIEFSARNVAVATIVALSGLERLDLTMFSAAYGAIGFPMVAVVAMIMRRRSQRTVG